jgi:Tol biopolymer transport system component
LETDNIADWSERLNRRDGHPHATPDGATVVFDTYPDAKRHQRLFLWNDGDEEAQQIARIPSPMKYWDTDRVDLHPRIRRDGAYLAFDAGYSGVRSLVTARLPHRS